MTTKVAAPRMVSTTPAQAQPAVSSQVFRASINRLDNRIASFSGLLKAACMSIVISSVIFNACLLYTAYHVLWAKAAISNAAEEFERGFID